MAHPRGPGRTPQGRGGRCRFAHVPACPRAHARACARARIPARTRVCPRTRSLALVRTRTRTHARAPVRKRPRTLAPVISSRTPARAFEFAHAHGYSRARVSLRAHARFSYARALNARATGILTALHGLLGICARLHPFCHPLTRWHDFCVTKNSRKLPETPENALAPRLLQWLAVLPLLLGATAPGEKPSRQNPNAGRREP